MAARIVGNDGVRNAVLREFERGQQRALIAWPRLVDPDVQRQPGVMPHIHRRGRGAVIGRRQPPRIAMRQYVELAIRVLRVQFAEQRQPVLADGARQADILLDDGIGTGKGRIGARRGRQRTHRAVDLVKRPAQIHRRGACRVEHRVVRVKAGIGRIGGERHRQPIRPRHRQQRCPACPHFPNGPRGGLGIAQLDPQDFPRQFPLVENPRPAPVGGPHD